MRVRFVRHPEPATPHTVPAMQMPAMPELPLEAPVLEAPARPRPAPSAPHPRSWWPWLLTLALIATAPVLYYVGEATYSAIVVEAPGFLRQRQVFAYVPPANLEYAAPGQGAKVTLPDGTSRKAQVIDVPDTKRLIPSDPYDSAKIGVLVRMRFTEEPQASSREKPARLQDGLPVRVRFDPRVDAGSGDLTARVQQMWSEARARLKAWRSQPQQ